MNNYPESCIDCDGGKYETKTVDYETISKERKKITVPNVEVIQCDSCGQMLIPAKSSKKISKCEQNNP